MDFLCIPPSRSLWPPPSPHSIFSPTTLFSSGFLSAPPSPSLYHGLSSKSASGYYTGHEILSCILLGVKGGMGRNRQDASQDEELHIQFNDCLHLVLKSFVPAGQIVDMGPHSLHFQASHSLLKSTCRTGVAWEGHRELSRMTVMLRSFDKGLGYTGVCT